MTQQVTISKTSPETGNMPGDCSGIPEDWGKAYFYIQSLVFSRWLIVDEQNMKNPCGMGT